MDIHLKSKSKDGPKDKCLLVGVGDTTATILVDGKFQRVSAETLDDEWEVITGDEKQKQPAAPAPATGTYTYTPPPSDGDTK